MNQLASLVVHDDDVKVVEKPPILVTIDSCTAEHIRQDQRGRFVLSHKGKLLRHGFRLLIPKKFRLKFYKKQAAESACPRGQTPPIQHLDDAGYFKEPWMAQEEINLRLYRFNLTNDWSVFDDVPQQQHVSVMYPHVVTNLGETREQYEARLKVLFKIQD